MVSGGTRFTRPGRSRAAPRVIDVEVRPPHKTLYEVLVVPPTTSSRQIRKIARALRRNLPNLSDLDDVCLAEQVLGRSELRAEYDALLARAGAAKLTLPQIGPAIEGTRPAGAPVIAPDPSPVATPAPAPFSRFGRARAGDGPDVKILVRLAAAAAAIIIAAVGSSSRHRLDSYPPPQYQPIDLPRHEPPPVPRLDVDKLGLDKLEPMAPLRIEPVEPPRHTPPKPRPLPSRPHKAAPAPVAPAPVETP